MTRFWVQALILFASLVLGGQFAPATSQEAQPVDQNTAERVIAIGDLHGDFEAWEEIARAAGLIDADGRWSGKESTLVQLGDLTDRGPDSLKIIRHLQALQIEALEAGGQVIVLVGNHEAMNVIGDLRYVHPGEYEAFKDRRSKRRRDATWKANRERIEAAYAALDPPLSAKVAKDRWYADTPLGKLEHRRAWRPGGELAQWVQSLPAVVQIGETLFVHGGLSWERAQQPVPDINAQISHALSAADDADQSVLEDPLGPLWYRGNIARDHSGAANRPSITEELDQILGFHNATRLVVAHTPSLEGIVTGIDNRLVRIDTGIAAHYSGAKSYLEISKGRVVAHQRIGNQGWTSKIIEGAKQ